MSYARPAAGAAAVLAAAALLTGCGSSGPSTASTGGTTSASATSSAATPSSSSTTTTGSAVQVGTKVPLSTLAGHVASAMKGASSVHQEMTVGSAAHLSADYDVTHSAIRETLGAGSTQMEVLFVDGHFFVGGALAKQLKSPTPWVSVDPQGTDRLAKALQPATTAVQSALKAGAGSVLDIPGAEATVTKVDGGATTYHLVLTPAQVKSGLSSNPMLSQLTTANPKALQTLLAAPLAYDYTLDAQGRPQQMVMQIAGQTMTMRFSEWGSAPAVTAPPASQVTASSALGTGSA